MTTIIVNADDFGLTDGICRAILELFDARAISSTTLMVAAEGALDRFDRFSCEQLLGRAGVHLQLTGGTPLSAPDEVRSLVDHSGRFRDPRKGKPPENAHVALEWRRQIAAASEALGGPPTHLDSHHGVHRIPSCFDVYVELAEEIGVPVRGAAGDIAERMRREALRGTVALVRGWTGHALGPEALRTMVAETIAANPSETVVEVIAHPGYVDGDLRRISALSDARNSDREALLTLAQQDWPEVDGHRLGSYGEF